MALEQSGSVMVVNDWEKRHTIHIPSDMKGLQESETTHIEVNGAALKESVDYTLESDSVMEEDEMLCDYGLIIVFNKPLQKGDVVSIEFYAAVVEQED